MHLYTVLAVYTGYTQKDGVVSKLTKNIFLTLHVHNVHRQQWQLSKFHIHYHQFASHAYCRAVWPVSKMASYQEKVFCVLRLQVSRSVITVQCEFSSRFRKDAPHRNNIIMCYRQFVETGCLCKARVLVDCVCLMTTLKECVRCFNKVPASQWLEQAGNWTC